MKTSKKSRVLALALSMLMLVSMMSFVVMAEGAASPIRITSVILDTDAESSTIDVEVTYAIDDENVADQVTILATTTSYVVNVDGSGVVTNGAYINQVAKPAVADRKFNFVIDKDVLGQDNTLYVKIGGTDVDVPAAMTGVLETEGPSIMYGDVNGDGKVNTTDAGLILQYYSEAISEFPGENGLIAADVNGDDKINTTDAGLILQFYSESISIFPIEEVTGDN